MTNRVDLTEHSVTFPEPPQCEIVRDNLVGLLKDMFSPDRKAIIVQGPVGAGKTTLLAQFAKTFPDQCFTFFFSLTGMGSYQRYFLMELCEQMGKALGRNVQGLDSQDTDKLRQMFLDFYREIAQQARLTKRACYFVIDGLEWLSTDSLEQTTFEALLSRSPQYVYVLASSDLGRTLSLDHHAWRIPFFALNETQQYPKDFEIIKSELLNIHKTCEGMPGYLAAIRRILVTSEKLTNLPGKLPAELRGLFEVEWQRMQLQDENWLMALAVLSSLLPDTSPRVKTSTASQEVAKTIEPT